MTKKAKRRFYGGRAMLNGPGHHSTAAIVAEVEDTGRWKAGKNGYGEPISDWNIHPITCFQFSDCTRVVSFDLEWEDEEDFANTLRKVDTMISTLTKFRMGLEIEQERMIERRRLTELLDKKEDSDSLV